MTRTQRWRPDTCGCAVIELFDDTLPELPMTLQTYETKCAHHAALSDAEAFAAITAENQKKNASVNQAVSALGLTHNDIEWDFDGKRQVVLTVKPKEKSLEAQVADLKTALTQLAAGTKPDKALLDTIPAVTKSDVDALALQLKDVVVK